MVDITVQKRPRGDTVRPAVAIPNDVWNEFKYIYSNKDIRDNVISKLLQKQLEREVVSVQLNII